PHLYLMFLLSKVILGYLFGVFNKRSISEVQLMHNVGERKQVLERQDWLQVKLKSILIPSVNDSQKGQKAKIRTIVTDISLSGKIQSGS
uniref:Parathyroid hormone n=1 Tax=Astyanax mexicanus TaxID=7994 RepID=A0A8B9JRQ6_ASTMX